jgi:hypothetical protein
MHHASKALRRVGRSVDEPLSEREEAQEEAPSHVVLGHEQIPSTRPSPS